MKINLSTTKVQSAKVLTKLAKKAEDKLQKRLVNYNALMIDQGGIYRKMWSGEEFSGKFAISTNSLEQLFHIKNGELAAILVRGKDGTKKISSLGPDVIKLWTKSKPNARESRQILQLQKKISDATIEMKDNYGINHCVKNGKSTCIHSHK